MLKGDGAEDPLFVAAHEFISENKIGSPASDEIQEVTSRFKQSGLSELSDLKSLSQDNVNFLLDRTDSVDVDDSNLILEDTKRFLSQQGVHTRDPVNLDKSVRLLGAGYNILTGKAVSSKMFTYATRDTKCGIIVPGPAEFSKNDETKSFMEVYNTDEEMIKSRMKHLNVTLGVSSSTFPNIATVRAGFSAKSSESSSSSSQASC